MFHVYIRGVNNRQINSHRKILLNIYLTITLTLILFLHSIILIFTFIVNLFYFSNPLYNFYNNKKYNEVLQRRVI